MSDGGLANRLLRLAAHMMARVDRTGYKTGYETDATKPRASKGAGFQQQWRFNV